MRRLKPISGITRGAAAVDVAWLAHRNEPTLTHGTGTVQVSVSTAIRVSGSAAEAPT